MKQNKKIVLLIMDGWGCGDKTRSDAIANANTPFFDSLIKKYPNTRLFAHGEYVGLPHGQMGNSEVGHLNIGGGRIVYQDLVKINKAIEDKSIDSNPVLIKAFNYAKEKGKNVHFLGLVSDGGVHSSQEHLHKLCTMCKDNGLSNVYIHAFMDGRDTDPKSGLGFISRLEDHLSPGPSPNIPLAPFKEGGLERGDPARRHSLLPTGREGKGGMIASIIGRYYAMDRDKRWERIKVAYNMLVKGVGEKTTDVLIAIKKSYDTGITDEFIKPIVRVDEYNNPVGRIEEGDVVICFNFRNDRCREITQVLTQMDFPENKMQKMNLHYNTMTNYDITFKGINVVFEKEDVKMTIGEVLSKAGKKQIRIAETEKYAHVTFFFSGGREEPFKGEKRILIPSPKVATYDLKPEMSAYKVTDAITKELKEAETDFICLNFANTDMVGHTGFYEAVVKAVETVDTCIKKVVEEGLQNGYSFIIIADHGNADYMINDDGSENTAHSNNPVPCILIDEDYKDIKEGILADVAPTILTLMGMEVPGEMTGEVLIS
ncbi:MAG: 2,3-bisphosphoglycerate-independent phosphoglycerate mutase [Bacteroidota bacterium]